MHQPETIHIDIPASHKYLNVVGACVDAMLTHVDHMGETGEKKFAIQLAVHETCANVIDHAYAGRFGGRVQIVMTLNADIKPRCITVEVWDTGAPFDVNTVSITDLDEPHEHGYGLFLMAELMDEVSYRREIGGNCWTLLKYLDTPDKQLHS